MIDGKGMRGPQVPPGEPAPQGEGEAAGPDQPALDRNVQGRIGSHLRAMYDELMQQPIPDRFIDLLAELERSATKPTTDS
ncbi:NepR family anti-sigma factor [Methylobacterium platani]|uniref:Anti-sigma factor NepR domain-containing protein n=2 Tax=Methylobacterium platani TaxID=427683 RepID=A0A179S2L7_9HYPH|nr:NepR family anti-sigma factor [Methylobacterium platani]KMO13913.1 hypothetical protein SQ03_20605 [Methylobacterium platani JCM 14648]OAS20030.1 hypothetical protein A5481_23245 [Methylobacterium platani]